MYMDIENMVDRSKKIRADYFNDMNSVIAGISKVTKEKLEGTLQGSLTVILAPGRLETSHRLPPESSFVIYCGKVHHFSRNFDTDELYLVPEDNINPTEELNPVCEMAEAFYNIIKGHGKVPDQRLNVPCIFMDAYPQYIRNSE